MPYRTSYARVSRPAARPSPLIKTSSQIQQGQDGEDWRSLVRKYVKLGFFSPPSRFHDLGFSCDLPRPELWQSQNRTLSQPHVMKRSRTIRKSQPSRRTAAALVELAICLPLMAFLVGATIEACDLIFLRNTLATASYSGTLEISRAGCTETSIRNQITQVLDAGNIRDYSITVLRSNGASFATAVKGDLVRIQVAAVSASNLRIGRFIPTSAATITVQAIAIR